jgi:hypothetical protein
VASKFYQEYLRAVVNADSPYCLSPDIIAQRAGEALFHLNLARNNMPLYLQTQEQANETAYERLSAGLMSVPAAAPAIQAALMGIAGVIGEAASTVGSGSGGSTGAAGGSRIPKVYIPDQQFGQKLGQHGSDFGLDPSNPTHRQQFRGLIVDITTNYNEVRSGPWGGGGDHFFFRQGDAVVVTSGDGAFVTILDQGASNSWFQSAAPLYP